MPASDQLQRLLYILPAAAGARGIATSELAEALGVDARTIALDIEKATARAFYQPAGTIEPFTILIEEDHIQVVTHGEFERPVRLNEREALALELGLRALAAEAESERAQQIHALARRLDRELSAPDVELQPRTTRTADRSADESAAPDTLAIDLAADDARGVLADAMAQHCLVGFDYVKPGNAQSEPRRVAPQRLICSRGTWYLAGCEAGGSSKVFRIDRMVNVTQLDERFVPAQLPAARVETYAVDQDDTVIVRYSARVARWVREVASVEAQDDGSVLVRHSVADPRWLVRHILQYGGDAVVETPGFREFVARAAERLTR